MATGVGRRVIACAPADQVWRADHGVRHLRLPRLAEALVRAGTRHRKSALFRHLARAEPIVIDDFCPAPLGDALRRDLLESVDDRSGKKSTIRHQPAARRGLAHDRDDPTLADAILDRLIHNACR